MMLMQLPRKYGFPNQDYESKSSSLPSPARRGVGGEVKVKPLGKKIKPSNVGGLTYQSLAI
jgi:hypothetical protein